MMSFVPHEPVEVEPFFRKFVVEFGGEPVGEQLDQPDYENADFFFPTDTVVAELKCLEKDFGIASTYRDSITKKIEQMGGGRINQ